MNYHLSFENNVDTEAVNKTGNTGFRSIASLIPAKTIFSNSARLDVKDMSQFENALKTGLVKNINASDDLGWTFLHYASARNNAEAIAFLIKNGANTEITNSDGETPLFVATVLENVEAIRTLVKLGANVDIRNSSGDHILYIVDHMKNQEVKNALQLELKKKTIDIYSNPKIRPFALRKNIER